MLLYCNLQGALNLQDNFLEGDRKVNAHFGQSIAAVGDLNADGFQGKAGGYFLLHGISFPIVPALKKHP